LELAFAGADLAEAVLGSLAHRLVDPAGAQMRIGLWAGPAPASLPLAAIGPGGLVRGSSPDAVSAVYEPHPGVLTLFDRASARVLYRIRDAALMPWWERTTPLRPTFHFAFAGPGSHMVHGAVIGDPERGGVLLAGRSGSGKTTLALACVERGMRYVADDYILLEDGIAWNVYRTANVDAGPDREKIVVTVPSAVLIEALPIRAVVAPAIRGGRTGLVPVSAAAALRALATSTALHMPFDRGAALAKLTEFVRPLPCYRLDLGDSFEEAVDALQGVLGDG
jgi:hypothetical protein